jgi:hypothetical protein
LTYRTTATSAALATLGPLPNTSNTVDSSLKDILLGQQSLDAALTSGEITIAIKLNVACRYGNGRTLGRSSPTLNLET